MQKKKVIIIGAGPGGLAAAMILAHRGLDVEIFEKDNLPGGRSKQLKIGEFTFDTGPTFLMMKHVLDEIFSLTGRDSSRYIEFKKLDPMYRLMFIDKEVIVTSNIEHMTDEIERKFPGNSVNFRKYLADQEKKLGYLIPCLTKPYLHLYDMFKNPLRRAIPHLELHKTVYSSLRKYFSNEELKLCFTFQSKYLGMSAWECPGAFSIIPYVEQKFGIFHTIGGLNKISEAMAKVSQDEGAKIHFNRKVKK